MISPSAPLSNSARALISLPLSFPTSLTLMAIDGDLIFRTTSGGTGSESSVAKILYRFREAATGKRTVPTDSAAVERFKNPGSRIWTGGFCWRVPLATCTGLTRVTGFRKTFLLPPGWLLHGHVEWISGCFRKRGLALISSRDIHAPCGLPCHSTGIVCWRSGVRVLL